MRSALGRVMTVSSAATMQTSAPSRSPSRPSRRAFRDVACSRRSPGSTCGASVVPVRGEPGVVVGLHDVRDPRATYRDPGAPVELGRDASRGRASRTRKRRLRAGLDGLVDRREGRRRVERQAEHGLARRPDDALRPLCLGRREHVVGREDVVCGTCRRAAEARGGDRGEVDDGVEARERLGGLAVGRRGRRAGTGRGASRRGGCRRWSRRGPARAGPHHPSARLAAAAGDDDPHRALLPQSASTLGSDLRHRRSGPGVDREPEHVRAVVVAGRVEVPPGGPDDAEGSISAYRIVSSCRAGPARSWPNGSAMTELPAETQSGSSGSIAPHLVAVREALGDLVHPQARVDADDVHPVLARDVAHRRRPSRRPSARVGATQTSIPCEYR